MRRRLTPAALVLAAGGLLGLAWTSTAPAQQEPPTLTVTKVVDGPGPTGGFVIEVDCTDTGLTVLQFDAAGPDAPESQSVPVASGGGQTCTVTEVDANGADATSYACTDSGEEVTCASDQQINAATETVLGTAEITVTNTFEADVEPAPPVEPPVTDEDVVEAAPPYTG